MFPPPHDGIAPTSGNGSPLLLRLRSSSRARHGHLWVRVHDNGELEQVDGDARRDGTARLIATLGRADPRIATAAKIRDELRSRLSRRDLTTAPPWGRYYPVQAFAGEEPVVEGFIGVEVDMGVRTDIFGLQDDRRDDGWLVDGIDELLGFLRG